MKIVSTLYDITEIEHLKQVGSDVVLVHTENYTRNTKYAKSIAEIKDIIFKAHQLELEVYLLFNIMIHEQHLVSLDDYFQQIKDLNIDAFVCFDFSFQPLLQKYHLADKIIYQPGTLTTNYYDPIFCKENNLKGMTLSKEITLQNMLEIMTLTEDFEYSLVGHGYLEMFYSRRPLLTNYFLHKNMIVDNIHQNHGFHLIEELRQNELYPIIEDKFGTTIFRSHQLNSFNEIMVLSPYLSDFFVERIFMSSQMYYDTINAYKNPDFVIEYMDKYKHTFDTGFYYRDISFTKEGNE